jgi:UDP-N-acetylglucosamine diphosphorylase / glucose-1-phosphate thymidylyltransferase / UDP-N-acetylgalactosamine diphosphorylase / glucosamine-1-phosphate N-acetyltransferase / galactosamine-1-phosphate N-acetyltransferase
MDYIQFQNLIKNLKETLVKDLAVLRDQGEKIQSGVYFGKNVTLEPNVFFDTSLGDIYVGEGTKIKANVILRGPVVISTDCVIHGSTEIACSKIGKVCRIGGGVMNSVIDDYTNKQHLGFVGHSYLGKWVNIGGGTNISNSKTTYGNIKMRGVDTGMQFLGCIIGDNVKTAVNTSIFCGKIIGPSSHLYGMVTEDVPAFTSYVSTGNMYELPLEVAIKAQKAMAARRGIEFTNEDQRNFEELFADTAQDREKARVKKEKLTFSARGGSALG